MRMPLTGNKQETRQKKVEVNDWTPKKQARYG